MLYIECLKQLIQVYSVFKGVIRLSLDPLRVILTILNFIVLYLFLKHKFFQPVSDFIDKRRQAVENQIEDARKNLEKSNELKQEYINKIEDSKKEGKSILDEYKSRASSLSDEIIDEAKRDAESIRNRAKLDAEREIERAKDEIKNEIVNISLMAASKVIGEKLDEEKHHKMILDFIDRMGA